MFVAILSNDTKILRPCFHSYDELKEIMKIAFEMYEDFKRELIMNLRLKPEIETALKKLTLLIDTQNFLLFERKL